MTVARSSSRSPGSTAQAESKPSGPQFQTLPFVVLDRVAHYSGSPQHVHSQRRQFSLPQPALPEPELFALSQTCCTMAMVTRPMRFHTLRFDNCAVDDERMEWLKNQEDLLPYIRHLTVGPKGLSGCRCPSKVFRSIVSRMTQLESLHYRSKRPLTPALAKVFATLERLKGVFVSGTGFTSSPALNVFKNLQHLILFPENLNFLPSASPPMLLADPEDTWDPSRRTFDTRAIHQALAQSAHTIEQVYIAFGYEREGDEAKRIFQLPAKEGCGVERCVSRNGRGTLAFPRLKQLFLRTSDLSASFFPSLLLGSPKLQSLWITHSPTSHSSHFEVPLAALPDLVELNINLPFALSSADNSGLQNLVKNKSQLRDLVLSEDVPLEVMFAGEGGKDIETFTTWGGVSKSLLKVINDKLVGLKELSFEGSSWSDEDLSIRAIPSLISNLKGLRTIEMPYPFLPSEDVAPTFLTYLHEAPLSPSRPDPWLEAAALSLFKTHLPSMIPGIKAFADQTGVKTVILLSENTEWRWTIGETDVELKMNFRPVVGGEIFGGGFTAPREEAWSLGQTCAFFY